MDTPLNAIGSATITVNLQDNGGTANGGIDTSISHTFTISINFVNQAPSFTLSTNSNVFENAGSTSIPNFATSILAGPPNESGQVLAFTLTSNSNTALFSVQPAISAAGTLTFTPATNTIGSATLFAFVKDNGGVANGGVDTSLSQSFTINVNFRNQAPTFSLVPNVAVPQNSGPATIPNVATAISPGPANESGQTVQFNIVGNSNSALIASGPALDSAGTLTFTPATGAAGLATITVTLQDNGGTANGGQDTSVQHTFNIAIGPVNTPPSFTINPNVATGFENAPYLNPIFVTNISPGLNAFESSQAITFTITTNSNPALFAIAPQIFRTGLSSNANLGFVPALNQTGSAVISVQAQDNGGTTLGGIDTSPIQTFTIVIAPVNQQPTFTLAKPTVIVGINSPAVTVNGVVTNVLAGPPNESFQALAFTLTSNSNAALFAVQPTLTTNGNLSFTPTPNVYGVAVLKVLLMDNGGTANGGIDTSAPQFLTIVVAGAPVAANGSISVASNATGSGTLTGSDSLNSPPLALTFSIVTNGNLGTATITDPTTGAFTYKPKPGASGLDLILFQCSNGYVASNLATEFIFITNPTINSPFATPNPATIATHADGTYAAVTFTAMATDTINAQSLTYLWDFGDGAFGSGSSIVHHYMSAGIYAVKVTATNGAGQAVSSTLSVTVYAGVFGTGPDSDNDGFSDTLETAYGTNPNLAISHPPGDPAAPLKLNVQKLDIALAFGKTNHDSITLQVLTPFPTNIAFQGQRIAVDVGGNVVAFTLDQKLRAKTAVGSIAFSIDRKFKVFRFVLALKKGTFSTSLAGYGLVSTATKKTSVTVPLTVLFGGEGFVALQPLTFQAHAKTGRAKVP